VDSVNHEGSMCCLCIERGKHGEIST
jgi:hypothetical protein